MPSKQRIESLERRIIEAALDQPNPTSELKELLQRYLNYIEHRDRLSETSQAQSA